MYYWNIFIRDIYDPIWPNIAASFILYIFVVLKVDSLKRIQKAESVLAKARHDEIVAKHDVIIAKHDELKAQVAANHEEMKRHIAVITSQQGQNGHTVTEEISPNLLTADPD